MDVIIIIGLFTDGLPNIVKHFISNSGPVHTYKQRENKLQLDQIGACSYTVSSEIFCLTAVIVACSLCSFVCNGPELETTYKQATRTALTQNISLGRKGLIQGKVLKRENFHSIQLFWKMQCIFLQNLVTIKGPSWEMQR